MLKKMVLLPYRYCFAVMVGVLILSNLYDLGYAEKGSTASDTVPQQILFEGRVIEVKDRNFFKNLGLNINYDSAEGRSVIREEGLGKILAALKDKDNPAVQLLAYGTATTISGRMASVTDVTLISSYDIENGQFKYTERAIGATFEFVPRIGRQSSLVTIDIHPEYSSVVGWEKEAMGVSQKRPIIRKISTMASLIFRSGDTIVLGGSRSRETEKTKDEGRILFLITIKVQDITQ